MSGRRYQVHFLSPNASVATLDGNKSTSRRSIEAARSEARSHAARVSHPSAKGHRPSTRKVRTANFVNSDDGSAAISPASERGSNTTSPVSVSPGTEPELDGPDKRSPHATLPILKFRLHVENGKDKRTSASRVSQRDEGESFESVRRRGRATSVPVSLPKEISKSALDPFARSALELSVPDEHLLHVYLSTVPDQIYGSSASDVSEIIRNGTVGVVATNDVVVMWLLLVIESQVVSFQPTRKERQLSILTRRSVVYRLMNERLTDENTPLMDDYILAVAVAAASEHRMGNAQGAQYHIRAVRKLLEWRGGLTSIRNVTYPLGLMIVNIFVEQGVDGMWKSHDALQKKVADVSQWIRDVQSWNFTLRHHAATTGQVANDYPTPESEDGHDQESPFTDYQSRRARAFAPKTALYDYVALPEGPLDEAQYRFYLGILFALNSALYAFRDSESTTTAYLKGVTSAVEMSALHNFTLRAGGAKLPSLLLLLMIAHKAVDSGDRNESTEVVFHVEQVFEFVEIMMMATAGTRKSFLRALESCLVSPIMTTRDLAFMNNAKLDILAGEVEDVWLSENLHSTGGSIG
ncbi:hypothetical protein PV04_06053 [Phialophora macrospora]|uniref:Transcription factor domain-containing protein n=1 Tax=Phialophora macrospora TaxID=1851006 RepID=A0A0D2G3V8_9EURO|nr:hypothetical protein PV04_06053 [Phialophora macrospora]